MATYVPQPLPGNAANAIVIEQIDRLNDLADDLLEQTNLALTNLGATSINTVDLDPRFQWDEGDLEALLNQLGEVPTADLDHDWLDNVNLDGGDEAFNLNPEVLARLSDVLPEYVLPAVPTLPAMPEEPSDPGEPGAIVAPSAPVLPTHEAPDTDITESEPEFEDYTASIPFPTLRPISLPAAPTIDLGQFQFEGVRPEFDLEVPDAAQFNFDERTYEPQMLEEVKAAISRVLQGGTGIPAEVEDALFEQAREREMELAERDVQMVADDYASRNFKHPPGARAKRIDRLRRDASGKVSQINREAFIQRWRLEAEQFRAVISGAIGLEEMWVGAFNAAENIRFQAARMRLDFALQVFNAQIARVEAQARLYQIDAEVYRTRIEGEAAKVQAYGEQLRAQALIGELNKQDVDVYQARLNALVMNAEIYKARVQGYAEKFRAIEARVSIYRAKLEGNRALAGVYESEVRAFGEKIRAQATRDERFAIRARIFSTKTEAKKIEYDALLAAYNQHFKIAELRRDTFVANSERTREYLTAERTRIEALVSKYQAMASQIGAKSEVERTRYQLMLAFASAQIERMKAAADVLLKNGEINIQTALQAANLMVRARETAATTLGQLAAGMTSAANVNAGISHSMGASLSYSYNGDLEVA